MSAAEVAAESYPVDESAASPAPSRPALVAVETSPQPAPESTALARWRFDLREIGSFQDPVDVELIGRDRERVAIRAFLDRPAPGVLLLDGEAGIGKSSLWHRAIAEEDAEGVLLARPTAAEAELSFAALGDLLAEVLEEALPALPGPQRRGLEAALLLADADGRPPDQRTIGTALLNAIRALSSRRPLVVAIDDIQWLDPASRSALIFCARRLRDEPVRLLLAARTAADNEQPPELALAAGEERLTRLSLGPLSLGAVRSVLKTRLDASFPRPVLRQLYETAGGNPFLALELARELERQEAKVGPGEPLPVPRSLRQLLEQRIGRLSPAAREVLLAVSAAGKTVEADLAAGAEAIAGVDEAVAAEILVRAGEELVFSHPLLRSTVYELASLPERQLVHRRLAESAVDAEERARHLAVAVEAPDVAVAAALDEAAQTAFARGAIDSAATLAEQAIRFTPDGSAALARRQLAAAGFLARAGSMLRARDLIEAALREAPPGPDRARIALGLAWWGLGDDATRVAALQEAVDDARDDPGLLAQVHALLGAILFPEIDIDAAEHHAAAALTYAERIDDPEIVVLPLVLAEHIDFFAGRGVDFQRVERALALEASSANPWGEIGVARVFHCNELLAIGELDAARSKLEALAAEGRHRGDSGYADVLVALAVVEARAGNWDRAQDLADEALEIAGEVDPAQEAWCHWPLTLIAALRGDAVTARAVGAGGLRLADRTGSLLVEAHISSALGLLELSLGNAETAHSHLRETARLVARMQLVEPGLIPFVPDLVEALVAVGELEKAESAAAELEGQGQRLARATALAGALRCRGLIAAARGDLAAASELLEAARVEAVPLGQPFELARTLLALGSVQRRSRQRRRARETLHEAERVFEYLGASLWAEQTRAELARIGGRSRSADGLTPSERRIAELVAEGKTNKEVAATLVVTDRTVESALTQIYRKLDVRSRTELARRLTSAH